MDKIAFFYDLGYQMTKEAKLWERERKRDFTGAVLKGLLGGAVLGGFGGLANMKLTDRRNAQLITRAILAQKPPLLRRALETIAPSLRKKRIAEALARIPKSSPKQLVSAALLGALTGGVLGAEASTIGESVFGTEKPVLF